MPSRALCVGVEARGCERAARSAAALAAAGWGVTAVLSPSPSTFRSALEQFSSSPVTAAVLCIFSGRLAPGDDEGHPARLPCGLPAEEGALSLNELLVSARIAGGGLVVLDCEQAPTACATPRGVVIAAPAPGTCDAMFEALLRAVGGGLEGIHAAVAPHAGLLRGSLAAGEEEAAQADQADQAPLPEAPWTDTLDESEEDELVVEPEPELEPDPTPAPEAEAEPETAAAPPEPAPPPSPHAAACAALLSAARSADYPALSAALQAHSADTEAQTKGCQALIQLLQRGGAAARAAASDAGCAQAVLAALRAHPDSAALSAQACGALASLTAAAGGGGARAAAAEAGAARAALEALQSHGSAPATAARALWLMCNLCEKGAPADVEPGLAVRAVRDSLAENGPGSAELALYACQALTQLCGGERAAAAASARAAARAARAPDAVAAALRAHAGGHEHAAARGCSAAGSLAARDAEGQDACGEAGLVACVLEAMSLQPGSPSVQHHGAWALASLTAAHEANRERAAAGDAVNLLCLALTHHHARPAVQEWACRALIELLAPRAAAGGCAHAAAAEAAGAVSAAAGALRAAALAAPPDKGWEAVALYSCWALAVLSWRAGPLRAAALAAGVGGEARRLLEDRPGSAAAEKARLLLSKLGVEVELAALEVGAEAAGASEPASARAEAGAEEGVAGAPPAGASEPGKAAAAPAKPKAAAPAAAAAAEPKASAPAATAKATPKAAPAVKAAAPAVGKPKPKAGPKGGCCAVQ